MLTRRPREANAMASGRPTCPHPPITTMSRAKGAGRGVSATGPPRVDSGFGGYFPRPPKWDSRQQARMHPSNYWGVRYDRRSVRRSMCSGLIPALDYFAGTVLTILWLKMTNHTGAGQTGRAVRGFGLMVLAAACGHGLRATGADWGGRIAGAGG